MRKESECGSRLEFHFAKFDNLASSVSQRLIVVLNVLPANLCKSSSVVRTHDQWIYRNKVSIQSFVLTLAERKGPEKTLEEVLGNDLLFKFESWEDGD